MIYISLEEREELLQATMAQKGWDMEAFDDRFYLLRLDPTDFNLAVSSIKSELPRSHREHGSLKGDHRPISLFEGGLFEDEADRRQEMFRLIEVMRDEDCTLC